MSDPEGLKNQVFKIFKKPEKLNFGRLWMTLGSSISCFRRAAAQKKIISMIHFMVRSTLLFFFPSRGPSSGNSENYEFVCLDGVFPNSGGLFKGIFKQDLETLSIDI